MIQLAPQFTISRTFDMPREILWKAWTVPEIMAKWWGPKGFIVRHFTQDFKLGGTYLYCIQSPEGLDVWGKFTYTKIEAPSRLEFISSFSNEHGGVTRHPGSAEWPLETTTVIQFEPESEVVRLTVTSTPYRASEKEIAIFAAGLDSMKQGWTGTLEQLGGYISDLAS